ncbi:MAG: dipeptide epimerase [Robiginitomaculum sp.]|nr:MAG: dipeptide epimerase [Robiginitomaculum sp.]
MHIKRIEISKLNVPTHHPVRLPIGLVDGARNVIVKIVTQSGIVGWGEASPFQPVTKDTQDSNAETALTIARQLLGKDARLIAKHVADMQTMAKHEPSIRSAFDMALYDIAAKAENLPLYKFLGGTRRELRTNLTIGLQDSVAQTLTRAEEILGAGFNAIKMKTGRSGLKDIPHIKAVRALAGTDMLIKIDSNQGWDYETALAALKALAPYNLQYAEQPLPAHDIDGLAKLKQLVALPICADESVFDDADAQEILARGAADYLNIKLGKSGGIHTALKIDEIGLAAGAKSMIGCFAETRLGLSAGAHFAMARPNIVFIDLDSAFDFKHDPVIGGMRFDEKTGGLLHLPGTAGHGASIDERALLPNSTTIIG